jgi:hypothetical protein
MQSRFRTAEKSSAYLHGACAKHKRRRNPSLIRDAARGHIRNAHGIDNRWDERHQSNLPTLSFAGIKAATVSASFHSLDDHDVRARTLGFDRLADRRHVRKPRYSALP